MKTLVVGGDIDTGKKSKITDLLSECFFNYRSISNGVLPKSISGYDLTIWMPNISNEKEKDYPIKDKGSVLICSKVMRDDYTHVDSVKRIFKMHGNAVIEIYKDKGLIEFELRDALNNLWGKRTMNINDLGVYIHKFYNWTKESIRRSLKQKSEFKITDDDIDIDLYYKFIQINRRIADKVAVGCNNRFFGNYSTRCTKLFPSYRNSDNLFLFSPRNIDKRYVTPMDKVICDYNNYYGNKKPSVDTPVQLEIYHRIPEINYMVHGHAYIKGERYTNNYFPCGDMREVNEVVSFMREGIRMINLKNHGFIIASKTIEEMENYYNTCDFKSL